MSGRGERTAGAPGVPGPRGGAPRCSAADREAHRPVSAWTAADAAPAARSNRGDKARAAGAASTSTFATVTREVAPLDLHEGIGDPRTGCPRWPERMALRNDATGELRPGRCRATNLCSYCQTLYVVETVEMLTLDALRCAPTLWLVLTAREHLTGAGVVIICGSCGVQRGSAGRSNGSCMWSSSGAAHCISTFS
jgi:hypothetical protein